MDADAIPRGVDFLLRAQGVDGAWRDFRTLAGEAVDWPTAYVGGVLGAVDDSRPTRAAVERAGAWLVAHQQADGGWGYHAGVPSDADTTAHALALLAGHGARSAIERPAIGGPAGARAVAFLERARDAAGGVPTYADPAPIRAFTRLPSSFPMDGWTRPHASVTAAAGRALALAGNAAAARAAWTWLAAARQPEGGWRDYWWAEPFYPTAQAVALADAVGVPDGDPVLRSTAAWLLALLDADGTVRCPNGQPATVFGAAAALLALVALAAPPDRLRAVAVALGRAQEPDGGWPTAPILRIPRPDVADPDDLPGGWQEGGLATGALVADHARTFTTATAVAALAAARDAVGDGPRRTAPRAPPPRSAAPGAPARNPGSAPDGAALVRDAVAAAGFDIDDATLRSLEDAKDAAGERLADGPVGALARACGGWRAVRAALGLDERPIARVLGFGALQTRAFGAALGLDGLAIEEAAVTGAIFNLGVALFDRVSDGFPLRAERLLARISPTALARAQGSEDRPGERFATTGDLGVDFVLALADDFFARARALVRPGSRPAAAAAMLAAAIPRMYDAEVTASRAWRATTRPDEGLLASLEDKSVLPAWAMALLPLLAFPGAPRAEDVGPAFREIGCVLWLVDDLVDLREDWESGRWSRPWLLWERGGHGVARAPLPAADAVAAFLVSPVAAAERDALAALLRRVGRGLPAAGPGSALDRVLRATVASWAR